MYICVAVAAVAADMTLPCILLLYHDPKLLLLLLLIWPIRIAYVLFHESLSGVNNDLVGFDIWM